MLNRNSTTEEVIAWTKQQIWPVGTTIEQVGNWVWITFSQRPSADVLHLLHSKDEDAPDTGWRWINKRGAWAHPCGHHSFGCKGDPRDSYGVQYKKVEAEV